MLDVLREFGCLSLRFDFRRLVSDLDVPHRVVRIPHFGPGSGRRTRTDPRAVLGNWPRGRGAAAPPLRSSSRAVLDQLKPRLLRSTRLATRGRHTTSRASKTRARELESFADRKTTSATSARSKIVAGLALLMRPPVYGIRRKKIKKIPFRPQQAPWPRRPVSSYGGRPLELRGVPRVAR